MCSVDHPEATEALAEAGSTGVGAAEVEEI
jgi:hypothetical protein